MTPKLHARGAAAADGGRGAARKVAAGGGADVWGLDFGGAVLVGACGIAAIGSRRLGRSAQRVSSGCQSHGARCRGASADDSQVAPRRERLGRVRAGGDSTRDAPAKVAARTGSADDRAHLGTSRRVGRTAARALEAAAARLVSA